MAEWYLMRSLETVLPINAVNTDKQNISRDMRKTTFIYGSGYDQDLYIAFLLVWGSRMGQ
jgi:hypothetical protein